MSFPSPFSFHFTCPLAFLFVFCIFFSSSPGRQGKCLWNFRLSVLCLPLSYLCLLYTLTSGIPLFTLASRSLLYTLCYQWLSSVYDRLVGLVVRRPPRERKVRGLNPACGRIFSGSSHTSDLKNWHSSGYPARCLALIGSALGLVGLVSVYCDWVR